MNDFLRTLARLTRPLSWPIAGRRWLPIWAVIRYAGRRSGRAYATPIVVRTSGDWFMVPLPFAGAQWVRNVLAAGGATLRWKGTDLAVTRPRVVDAAEGLPAFNRVQRRLLSWGRVVRFLRVSRADAAGSAVEQREGRRDGPDAVGGDRVQDELDVADALGRQGS